MQDTPLIMYRVPAQSVEGFLALARDCDGKSRDAVVKILLDHCANPEVQMLLSSASHGLVQNLVRETTEETTQDGTRRLRTARALAGYISRMSTRCTPFGLLVTVGCGQAGEVTDLDLPPVETDTVAAALAPHLGTILASQLANLGDDHTDATAYLVRGRYRRYEHRRGTWHLQELDESLDPTSLIAPKINAPLSAMEPSCVEEFLVHIAEVGESNTRLAASKVLEAVQQVDGPLTPAWSQNYESCQASIDELLELVAPEFVGKSSPLILCNRICRRAVTIAHDLVEEIRLAASIIHRLHVHSEAPLLTRFSSNFSEKYGDAFVPVLEAIDPGCGVGYIHGEGISLEIFDGNLPRDVPKMDVVGTDRLTLCNLLVATNIVGDVVNIGPEWYSQELGDRSFSVLGSVAHEDRFLLDFVTVDDFRLMGRFAPDVPGLAESLRRRASARAEANTIDAEVAYLPFGRDANVVRRAAIYPHEIVCHGRASKGTTAIPVNELWLGIDRGALRLWWPRAGHWVRPRLSCAHNVEASRYPVYRFLAELASAENASMSWSWGAVPQVTRLPAVHCGRVQLASAGWRLQHSDCVTLSKLPDPQRASKLNELREEYAIPRWVQTGHSDNIIAIDLENPIFVDAMLHKAKSGDGIFLREPRFLKTNVVSRGGKSYCNEVVIAYATRSSTANLESYRHKSPESRLKTSQNSSTVSQWLTLQIYEERTRLEDILIQDLLPWTHRVVRSGLINKWHFLRYADPRQHLRFRLQGSSAALAQAIGEIYGLLQGVEFSIRDYSPEIQRYGGKIGMELSEDVFMADSWMAAEIVRSLPKDLAVRRWELSIGVIDSMLDAACISLADRVDLLTRMHVSYASLLGVDTSRARHTLSPSYRKRRAHIELVLAASRSRAGSSYESIMEMSVRSSELKLPLTDVISSLIHMHLNRVFGVFQMEQEVVVYEYLRRFYRSELANQAARKTVPNVV